MQKPPVTVHSQSSTGHANSPCTIVIGKAQLEKVTGPAWPYRVIDNFVVSKPRDFSEDLSGKSTVLALTDWSPVLLLLRVPRGWASRLFICCAWDRKINNPDNSGAGAGCRTVFKGEGAGLENKDRSPTVWGHRS